MRVFGDTALEESLWIIQKLREKVWVGQITLDLDNNLSWFF